MLKGPKRAFAVVVVVVVLGVESFTFKKKLSAIKFEIQILFIKLEIRILNIKLQTDYL